jgi:L-2-hydroxyglutarate oxidase
MRSCPLNASTYQKALFSPSTATVDPLQVCHAMKKEIVEQGVDLYFNMKYCGHSEGIVTTDRHTFSCSYVINAAGLYAERIAHEHGFGNKYTILPFKSLYLKYGKNNLDIHTNIYPVPDLKNPFLGVHFTKTVDGSSKIGPTAIPAFWREHYSGLKNLNKQTLELVQDFVVEGDSRSIHILNAVSPAFTCSILNSPVQPY